MKKQSRKLRRRRNAAPGLAGPKRRRRFQLRLPRPRSRPPDWRTTLAAIAGGAGGAALGGLVVNQQILSPETVGIGMMGIGGATAYFADGNTRVLGNSVAAAGAGQLALALMAKRAFSVNAPAAMAAPQLPPAPPSPSTAAVTPPPVSPGPPRRSSSNGGVVVDLFRDAALELEQLEEDDLRFGTRDAGASRMDVYDLELDLDDAA